MTDIVIPISPATEAAGVPSHASFTNDLAAHLKEGGIVVSCQEFFVMLRPVPGAAPDTDLLNPWMRWPEKDCDCWFIWLAAGNLLAAIESLTPLFGAKKLVAFQTGAQPKRWRFESLHSWLKVKTKKRQNSKRSQ